MNIFTKACVLGLFITALSAQPGRASVIDGPGLSLFAFNGERQINHIKGDPTRGAFRK